LSRINEITSKPLRFLLVVVITAISLLAVTQVVYRYILHWPGHFIDELLTFGSVWLYFLGALNASVEETHINARMLEIFFKKIKHIAGIRFVSAVSSIFISGWLAYWAFDFLMYSLKKGKISVIMRLPLTYYESALFICLVPMTVFACLEAYKYYMMMSKDDTMGVELKS
jgi:TRAP-type C4-dicarboxylate transport system permease small subunit